MWWVFTYKFIPWLIVDSHERQQDASRRVIGSNITALDNMIKFTIIHPETDIFGHSVKHDIVKYNIN
jgi:hypothetical protein